jgi:hypothetical protein
MSEDEENGLWNRPATLHSGAMSTDFPTLQDAIVAWHRASTRAGAESFYKNHWWAALYSA